MSTPHMIFDFADIQAMLGSTLYQRGRDYWRQQRVQDLIQDDDDPAHWYADVKGQTLYEVDVYCPNGDYHGEGYCTCPAFDDVGRCKHIAAVLCALVAAAGATGATPGLPGEVGLSPSNQLIRSLISALVPKTSAPSAAQTLRVQYLVHRILHGRDPAFAVELRVGVERLYVVSKIREFLDHVLLGKPHVFTKKFQYDPRIHTLTPNDRALFDIFQEGCDLEASYAGGAGYSPYAYYYRSYDTNRLLYVPPLLWDKLEGILATQDAVWADHHGRIQVSSEPLSLHFSIEPASDERFALCFDKPDRLALYPAYGKIVLQDAIHSLPRAQIQQWAQLYALPAQDNRVSVPLGPEVLADALTALVPALESLGTVTVNPDLQSRLAKLPLEAQAYLDLEDDVLVARLEFHYGSTIVTPGTPLSPATGTILIRDLTQEQRLIDVFHQSGFTGTERMYCAAPDAIYPFLHETLPALEDQMTIFLSDRLDPVLPRAWEPRVRADKTSGVDWLSVEFDFGDLTDQEIRGVLASLKEKRPYHRLPNGRFLALDEAPSESLRSLLTEWEVDPRRMKNGRLQMSLLEAVPLMNQDGLSGLSLGRGLRQWLDTLAHPDNLEATVPDVLDAQLRPYQVQGFQWMATLSSLGLGGILADDMGLGKTVQSIAYLLWARSRDGWTGPAVIVAPASLIYNWAEELRRFAPTLTVRVAAGSQEERRELLANLSSVDVLITSYPLLRRDIEWYRAHEFAVAIFDEAQALKNATTQTAQAALRIQSRQRFALTGTPVENALDDLWSIFRIISPGVLGSRERFLRFTPTQVAKRVKPFILRRLKSDVLKELPDKIETLQTAALTREQKAIYLNYLNQIQSATVEDLSTSPFHKSRMKILAGLTRLRQICCDPALFLDGYRGGSGKLDLLLELLEEALSSGRHILVFSQFTAMLSRIHAACEARGWSPFYLDGDTPVADRLSLVQRFNAGERPLFLISLKAGGTGLNLTGADTVILYDLWWNPAVEQQAVDRAHRIGQKHVVQVIRLMTQGTVEEKIYALQEKKRNLIDQVVDASADGVGTLTEEDIREILSIGTEARA